MAFPLSPETVFILLIKDLPNPSQLKYLCSLWECQGPRKKTQATVSIISTFSLNIFIRLSRQEWHSKHITLSFTGSWLSNTAGLLWKISILAEGSNNIYARHSQSITLVQRGKLSVMLYTAQHLIALMMVRGKWTITGFKGSGNPRLPNRMQILSGVPSLWSVSYLQRLSLAFVVLACCRARS